MIIADTNVVSEFMRDTPDPAVLGWAHSIDPADLTICVVTVEEIERGLGRLPEGRWRRDLQQRWTRLLEGSGRAMTLADAQIAGICLAGGHDLATRNVRDFSGTAGLTVIDPFE